MPRPRIAITTGDPAGIGPEIVLKALASADRPEAEYVIFGPMAILLERAERWGLRSPHDTGARVVDVSAEAAIVPGAISAAGGKVAAESVLRAVREVQAGRLDAIVTAPLHKESLAAAGYHWPG